MGSCLVIGLLLSWSDVLKISKDLRTRQEDIFGRLLTSVGSLGYPGLHPEERKKIRNAGMRKRSVTQILADKENLHNTVKIRSFSLILPQAGIQASS